MKNQNLEKIFFKRIENVYKKLLTQYEFQGTSRVRGKKFLVKVFFNLDPEKVEKNRIQL